MKRSILLTALLLAACTGAVGENLDVSVTLPATATVSEVAALHAWVVTGTEGREASCNLLVAGAQEPYDVELQLLGQGGARTGEALIATVSKREGVVYVVAFDYEGEPLYSGCSAVSSSSSVSVTLGTLRVYDCGDANTPPGARCEDGNPCTVAERCRSGSCTGGTARDCSRLNGLCNTGTCDPTIGCKKVPAPEGQACDDGLFCTGPGTCTSGTCVAPLITCPPAPGQCLQEGVCSNQYSRCIYLPKPRFTPCDDGDPCRTGDSCDYNGTCAAGSTTISATLECDRNACTQGDSCISGTCSTASATFAPAGTSCEDGNPCTTNDTCSGTSACVPGPNAGAGTPCWDGNYCYIGDQCTGTSSVCSGSTNYVGDYDADGYSRYGCPNTFTVDCDDKDPNTRPGAAERCGDGKDNDCDGTVDELSCVP
jgi:hypothetical protein